MGWRRNRRRIPRGTTAQGRLLIETHEGVEGDGDDDPIEGDRPAGEEDGLAEDQGDDRDVDRVADEAVETADHQGPGGRDRGRGAKPLPGEAGEGFKDDQQARGDQEEGGPAEGAREVARRQRAPVGDQPRNQPGDDAWGDDQEGETAKRCPDPIRQFPFLRSLRLVGMAGEEGFEPSIS